ncbi:hypothetical protein Tco_0035468, partial [Tanacetum coccineum]
KDTKPSKKAKPTCTSKSITKSQPKSTGKFAQAEETVFEAGDTQVPQNQGEEMGKTDEPSIDKSDPKDWFKKPKQPLTPDPEWNTCKTVNDGPTQNWLSDLAKAEKSSKTFSELMSTLIDFTAFAMNRLKPLPLIISKDRQIVPTDYFFNNDLAYLQGGSTKTTYTTYLTMTKAAKYDLPGIEDMEIEVRRSDQKLYKFMEGDFPRLHLNDVENMLLLVVQNRLFNLDGKVILHLAASLRMFTRRIVI